MRQRLEIFRDIIGAVFEPPHQCLLDLGAGHCRFTLAAREVGFPCTPVDIRADRIPEECRDDFRQADAREFDQCGFDGVLILGLLYHLDPESQIRLADRCRGRIVVLDTHTAAPGAPLYRTGDHLLAGTWYKEGKAATSGPADVRRSFWPTEESLRWIFSYHLLLKYLPEHAPGRAFWLGLPRRDAK